MDLKADSKRPSQPRFTKNFNESTRRLLHERLQVVALTSLGMLVLVKTLAIATHGFSFFDFVTRLGASIVIIGVYLFLRRRSDVSLRSLRICEAAIWIAILVESNWVMVSEVSTRLSSGIPEELSIFFLTFSFVYAILIATYGMYVPNNWRRTAIVTFTVALVPTTTALILGRIYDIPTFYFPGLFGPLLTLAMALVATQAAHVVHQIRREVEKVKLYGQYQLLQEIGRGGMGVVYKASHRMLKRPAAIKLIRNEFAADENAMVDFEHEVQLSANLMHWNTVQIYDYGRTDAGDFYYVMEHLNGETLKESLAQHGPMTIADATNVLGQVRDGLAEAHAKGMVHRDIKPENVFLTNLNGATVVKILDFGLASMKSDTERLQKVSGTPSYISPELIRKGTVDERSDIYALGCVLYECLTGEKLFTGESVMELLDQHINRTPSLELLPAAAQPFASIIGMCVAKDPEHRFRSVTAVKNAMQKVAESAKIDA